MDLPFPTATIRGSNWPAGLATALSLATTGRPCPFRFGEAKHWTLSLPPALHGTYPFKVIFSFTASKARHSSPIHLHQASPPPPPSDSHLSGPLSDSSLIFLHWTIRPGIWTLRIQELGTCFHHRNLAHALLSLLHQPSPRRPVSSRLNPPPTSVFRNGTFSPQTCERLGIPKSAYRSSITACEQSIQRSTEIPNKRHTFTKHRK